MRPIIIHTAAHAHAAMAAAVECATPLTLQSAPDALRYAGSLYLLTLFEQAQQAYPQVDARFILDAGHEGAHAIAAMQAGHRWLYSSAPEPLRSKLADIAGQYGIAFYTDRPECLDLLSVRDPQATCRSWLTHNG